MKAFAEFIEEYAMPLIWMLVIAFVGLVAVSFSPFIVSGRESRREERRAAGKSKAQQDAEIDAQLRRLRERGL